MQHKSQLINQIKMELPLASFILKLVLFSLVNLNYISAANNNKLLLEICNKTNNPKNCFGLLKKHHSTNAATSLHDLGLGFLDIAITRARKSTEVLNHSLKYIEKKPAFKAKYESCRDKYKSAVDRLSEAKRMVRDRKFSAARKNVEQVAKVPSSCETGLRAVEPAVRAANEMSNFTFNIAFVIVEELERR